MPGSILLPEMDSLFALCPDRPAGSATGGDVHDVIVGPPGIFVIDSKAWSARPRIQGEQLLVGKRDETSTLNKLISQAAFVRKSLAPSHRSLWVDPIIASTKTVPYGGCRRARGVTVVSAVDLAGFLRSRPSKLRADQVRDVAKSLAALGR